MKDPGASFETRCLSSLSKVFADAELEEGSVNSGTALWKEVYSFQIAYRSSQLLHDVTVRAESPLHAYITIRTVGLAPSEMPAYADPDPLYLRTAPGLFPDPLYPQTAGLRMAAQHWRSVWITVELPSRADYHPDNHDMKIEQFPIGLIFTDASGNRLGGETFLLEVIPADLPEQKLLHTEWFHCDCLATQYGVEVFSEPHWEWIERYLVNAAGHGINLIYTPLFTPPLDTAVGGERPTVQLVGVKQTAEKEYLFDFSRLERWIDMCRNIGIGHFEFSHLFTQWGAKHAPKIVADVDGEEKRIFGWETDAASDRYRQFLDQFLPQLAGFIRRHGLQTKSYFHVSDEPSTAHLDSYRSASEMLKAHLAEFSFIEALSDFEFYDHGLVPIPIPSNDHMGHFLEHGVDPLWTYYCCGQHKEVSNRFFSMPSSRNRILGMQLFKFGIQGFLHWGYNFWYSQQSRKAINPYLVTDADFAFPSGDAFVVYPGPDGPVDSIRWEVFREALQDLRALQLLESLAGKDRASLILEQGFTGSLTFRTYPIEADWLLAARERINRAIAEATGLSNQ